MFASAHVRWSIVLGFAPAGFSDGILLHQILQWHHLLSLVPAVDSLRLQVLWDGYFHAMMYVLAAVGLWEIWRTRAENHQGRALVAAMLIDFGLWHVVDSVLSHWTLGIHRIKLYSPHPLMWDMIWFSGCGVVPLLVGSTILRNRRSGGRTGGSNVPLILVGAHTAGAAGWSAEPPKGQRLTTVVSPPSVLPPEAMSADVAEGAALVWSDPEMRVLVLDSAEDRRLNFYRRDALFVSGSGSGTGCFNWERYLSRSGRRPNRVPQLARSAGCRCA